MCLCVGAAAADDVDNINANKANVDDNDCEGATADANINAKGHPEVTKQVTRPLTNTLAIMYTTIHIHMDAA